MSEFGLSRDDEPFDFRRQAATYGQYRRDYSDALYEAIARHAQAGGAKVALDVGCGTGFVTIALARRGWSVIGVDFSAPMLAEARAAGPSLRLVRARGETLPVRGGTAALITCGTSFHWLAPVPALAEFTRALVPGGWVACIWRYPVPTEPTIHLIAALLREVGSAVPDGVEHMRVNSDEPFAGSALEPAPPIVLRTTLHFSADEFHGHVATLEWVRRMAGDRHAALLDRLRLVLAERHPAGFTERNDEFLYLARKPA